MSRRPLTHPKRAMLVAWLDGAPDVDDVIAEHVGHCTKCSERLAELAATALAAGEEAAGTPGATDTATGAASDAEADTGPDTGADAGIDDTLAAALREIYAPPADLTQRVMKKIDERERADRELSLFLGLFSIGKDAAELFLPPDGDDS